MFIYDSFVMTIRCLYVHYIIHGYFTLVPHVTVEKNTLHKIYGNCYECFTISSKYIIGYKLDVHVIYPSLILPILTQQKLGSQSFCINHRLSIEYHARSREMLSYKAHKLRIPFVTEVIKTVTGMHAIIYYILTKYVLLQVLY